MVMYFQTAVERRPQLPKEFLTVGQTVAKELGVKNVSYWATYLSGLRVGITFLNVASVTIDDYDFSEDDGIGARIKLTDFDPSRLYRLKAALGVPYKIDEGGVSSDLVTGQRHLYVSVDVGEKKTVLVYKGKGTYKELEKRGFVRKKGDSYVPSPAIVLSEGETIATRTKGFLGLWRKKSQETIYEANEKTIEPVKANISVSAGGNVSVEERFLQNGDVGRALDAIVEDLFGLDLKPEVPVA